jgi:RNA polymerase sigma-70 factor, ECF subfamily
MIEAEARELMIKGLAGDGGAHSALLKMIAVRLRVWFRYKLPDREAAEDLVQETLIAVHTKRHTWDPAYPLTPWVLAIARYRMIDHFRKLKRTPGGADIDDFADFLFLEGDSESAEAKTAKSDVDRLLAGLPQKQRDAIRLIRIEEVSVRDAAQRLGISESDVKISVHRGLKALMAGTGMGAGAA